MNSTAMAIRALILAAAALGTAPITACSSDPRSSEAQSVGTIAIPLSTTVGSNTYRLDAVFSISGPQGDVTLTTKGEEPVLTTTLPTGSYSIFLESFTLSKDDGTGTFFPVAATVETNELSFTISASSTTTVSFHFLTDGVIVIPTTGDVGITFDVNETGCNPITVDAQARTVQSSRFFLDFSDLFADNPEDLDVLRWKGGDNLTQSNAADACTSGLIEHFGNSWAPPDPGSGGRVLVGSGSTGSWQQDGASIVIQSSSSGCAESAGFPIETHYKVPEGLAADAIEVERHFDFGSAPLNRPFRPFMPRLTDNFNRVIHPNATGTSLVSEDVFACPYGCQVSDWDGSWFAYYAEFVGTGQGMIVLRRPSSALPVNLWIDHDGGITNTNASSAVLIPSVGNPAVEVTETELLCFFDADSWPASQRAALVLPQTCKFDIGCNAGQ